MDEIAGENEYLEENPLKRIDRRNYTILAIFGIPMMVSSLYSSLSETGLLPAMWGELAIVVILGFLYYRGVKQNRADYRLGAVYTAVGIVLSFIIISVGILVSLLIVENFPFLLGSGLDPVYWLPVGSCVLVIYRYVHRISREVSMKQRREMNKELRAHGYEPFDNKALFLVDKKWTSFVLYLFLFVVIELIPIVLPILTPSSLRSLILIVFIFIIFLGCACNTMRESNSGFITKKEES